MLVFLSLRMHILCYPHYLDEVHVDVKVRLKDFLDVLVGLTHIHRGQVALFGELQRILTLCFGGTTRRIRFGLMTVGALHYNITQDNYFLFLRVNNSTL